MRIRDFKCAHCGGASDVPHESIVIMCSYCGAFVAIDDAVSANELGDVRASQERAMTQGTLEDRMVEVSMAMGAASARHDAREWRILAFEYYGLVGKLMPDALPAGRPRQEWLRDLRRSAAGNRIDGCRAAR